MWIPGLSTAGASRASNGASSRTGGLNWTGLTLCSGGKNAIEIRGERPSSRRRLAQNAVVMISSITAALGFGASVGFLYAIALSAIRASILFATILAAGYDGPAMGTQ